MIAVIQCSLTNHSSSFNLVEMKRIPIIILFALLSFFLFSKTILASTLLWDDFNDGNANDGIPVDWEEYLGNQGSWTAQDGEYVGRVVKYSWSGNFPTNSIAGNENWDNYRFDVRIKGNEGVDKLILFRYKSLDQTYAVKLISSWWDWYGDNIALLKNNLITWTTSTPFINNTNTWYNLSVEARGNNIKVYINNATEPIINYTDENNPNLTGKIGLLVWPGFYSGSGSITVNSFDDVVVTSLDSLPSPTPTPTSTPTPTPTPTPEFISVPYLNQKWDPWGPQEYDRAAVWSSEPTITRWGCALTSAAMTLLYYGINQTPEGQTLTPETLNNWLKNQADGYLREGMLNWYALTRLARMVNQEIGSTLLQFRRGEKDFNLLEQDLTNNQPPILEEPGHFIVATGKTDSSYSINDPLWEEKKTLETYGNDFLSLRRLFPITTTLALPNSIGLSALLLVSDPNVSLTVTDQNGNQVGQSYFQGPLIDDVDGTQTSGQGLNIFDFPQPPPGTYTISVTSQTATPFIIDTYSYDQEANATISSFFGLTSPESPVLFQVSWTNEGKVSLVQRVITFNQAKTDIRQAYHLNLIKSWVASNLINLLNGTEQAKNSGDILLAKKHLEMFLEYLNKANQWHQVDPRVYLLLKEEAEYLLNTLN